MANYPCRSFLERRGSTTNIVLASMTAFLAALVMPHHSSRLSYGNEQPTWSDFSHFSTSLVSVQSVHILKMLKTRIERTTDKAWWNFSLLILLLKTSFLESCQASALLEKEFSDEFCKKCSRAQSSETAFLTSRQEAIRCARSRPRKVKKVPLCGTRR